MDQRQTSAETLKSLLLFNLRTGNLLMDTIITGFIIMASPFIFQFITKVFHSTFNIVSKLLVRNIKIKSEITIVGSKEQGNDTQHYSNNFLAVLYQIKMLNCSKANISELSEVPMVEPQRRLDEWDEWSERGRNQVVKTSVNLIVTQKTPFQMMGDVWASVRHTPASNEHKKEEFKIQLYSEILNVDQLRSVLENWVREYEEMLLSDRDEHLKFYLYSANSDRHHCHGASFDYLEFRFESGRTFNNIFFDLKDDIIQRLDYFANNKTWYKETGVPYTLGFMFHGEPGCGKTSTIKAIANYTQRHIVSVQLSKIKTIKELLNLFYNPKINNVFIPLKKRLYVLEDIDAAEMEDTVGERGEKKESKNYVLNVTLNKEDGGLGGSGVSKKDDPKLSLATLLEVLDGVMEMEGRMLVITTNYPERLDKALTRPGRIDMNIEFGRMKRGNIEQMFRHYFKRDLPSKFPINNLPDQKWTPAEVTQMFLKNMDNPEAALKSLMN